MFTYVSIYLLPIDKHLGCFQFYTIKSNTAMNILRLCEYTSKAYS